MYLSSSRHLTNQIWLYGPIPSHLNFNHPFRNKYFDTKIVPVGIIFRRYIYCIYVIHESWGNQLVIPLFRAEFYLDDLLK